MQGYVRIREMQGLVRIGEMQGLDGMGWDNSAQSFLNLTEENKCWSSDVLNQYCDGALKYLTKAINLSTCSYLYFEKRYF